MENTLIALDLPPVRNALAKLLGFGVEPGFLFLDPAAPETPLPYAGSLDEGIWLYCGVPALTEKTLWAFLDGGPHGPGHSPRVPASEWVSSPHNLVVNGGMESGDGETPEIWTATANATATARRVQGGSVGEWCLELVTGPPASSASWFGWHQRVPVQPNARYLVSGSIKGKDLGGPASIHGHFRKADGALTEASPFFRTSPAITGDSDWRKTAVTAVTPSDCAFIDLHLTTNQAGALWHDAIFVGRTARAEAGRVETRASAPVKPEAWAVNPLVKVFHEDTPPGTPAHEVDIAAARNTRESFQIALRAPVAGAVSVRATAFSGPEGAVLDAPAIGRVGYVPIDFPVGYDRSTAPAYYRFLPKQPGNDGWRGWWPDPIEPLEGASFAIETDSTEALFFDVDVPADAPHGRYQGTVEVNVCGEDFSFPVALTVWNFTSPEEKHLPAILDLRNGRGWNIFGGGAEREENVRRWQRFLARYNVSPGFVEPSPDFRYTDGQVTMDAAAFDAAAAYLLDELHVNKVYTPNLFYACGWAYLPKPIFGLEAFSPEYKQAWSDAYRLFIEHITGRGWRDKFVFYLSDEPHESSEETISSLAQIADRARAIAPDVPIYSSTWRYIDGLADHLTLWGIGPQGSFDPARLEERRAAGDRFCYTTDGQMCTDTPLLAIERLLPWFCFRYGVEAYEFWGVSWWTHDPWQYGWHRYIRQSSQGEEWFSVRYPNGDGFLAYPSRDPASVDPVPTIRLAAVRDGVDDYEVFRALEACAAQGNADARAVLEQVRATVAMPNPGGRFSTAIMDDPDAVQAVRRAAGGLLSQLNTAGLIQGQAKK